VIVFAVLGYLVVRRVEKRVMNDEPDQTTAPDR